MSGSPSEAVFQQLDVDALLHHLDGLYPDVVA